MHSDKGRPTAIFIVRLWLEDGEGEKGTWRGQIEHVQSGRKEYVCQIAQVVRFLEAHCGEVPRQASGGIR
jgi:hypothetical protein